MLEGGYVPEVLGKSVVDIVRVLRGEMVEIPPKPPVSGGVKKSEGPDEGILGVIAPDLQKRRQKAPHFSEGSRDL